MYFQALVSQASPYNPSSILGTKPTQNLFQPPRSPIPPVSSIYPIPNHLPAVVYHPSPGLIPGPQVPLSHPFPGTCYPSCSSSISQDVCGNILPDPPLLLQAVKVLRTAEFVPYVVFIEAPDFDTLRAMNRAALESGVSTKQLTVRILRCGGRGLMASWSGDGWS